MIRNVLASKGSAVVTVKPSDTVEVLSQRLREERIGAAVVSGDGQSQALAFDRPTMPCILSNNRPTPVLIRLSIFMRRTLMLAVQSTRGTAIANPQAVVIRANWISEAILIVSTFSPLLRLAKAPIMPKNFENGIQ